jgi:hypothetical protein
MPGERSVAANVYYGVVWCVHFALVWMLLIIILALSQGFAFIVITAVAVLYVAVRIAGWAARTLTTMGDDHAG